MAGCSPGAKDQRNVGAELPDALKTKTTRYLDATLRCLDTLIREGTDRYGSEQSPMFCSILDLKTRRLPEKAPPLLPGPASTSIFIPSIVRRS